MSPSHRAAEPDPVGESTGSSRPESDETADGVPTRAVPGPEVPEREVPARNGVVPDGVAPDGGAAAGSAASPAADPAPAPRRTTSAARGDAGFTPSSKAVGRLRIQPRADSAPPPPKKGRWWELPVLAIIAVAVAVIVKTFIVQPFYIPSASMQHTLYGCQNCNGDKILVDKPIYDFRSPHPGDIIVFSRPDAWPADGDTPVAPNTNIISGPIRWFGQLVGVVPPDREDLVKRVIAVGGQTVKCCDAQGRVQVSTNGPQGPFRGLDEPYVFLDAGGSEMTFGPVTVPHGRLWVMGDHRTDSADSRYHCAPDSDNASPTGGTCDPMSSTVPISHVIGKAFVIAWPPGRWRTLGTPGTFKASASSTSTPATWSPSSELSAGLPLAAGVLAVLPLWVWRRRTRW